MLKEVSIRLSRIGVWHITHSEGRSFRRLTLGYYKVLDVYDACASFEEMIKGIEDTKKSQTAMKSNKEYFDVLGILAREQAH